jgi:hypothetical protein
LSILKCLFCLVVALAPPNTARADAPPQPAPPDGNCAVSVDPNWTKQEKFVWTNVCSGKEANFNTEPGYGGNLDPKTVTLPDNRILRSSFLTTILLADKSPPDRELVEIVCQIIQELRCTGATHAVR